MSRSLSSFFEEINRRSFLQQSALGIGGIAWHSIANSMASTARWTGALSVPHTPIKAKRVIHLCMAGGPSHLETFDWKPQLRAMDGQAFPDSFTNGQQLAQLQNGELKARGPLFDFKKHGETGNEIASIFPHLSSVADELCIIKSMVTEQINHDTAHAFMNSGSIIKGRPSMGAWLLYGLGSETESLPGFVVLSSTGKYGIQPISARQWSSGFLPSKFQGIQFQSKGDPVHYLGSPEGVCQSTQRQVVEQVMRMNGLLGQRKLDPEIETRTAQYEMAFRMQSSVPELTDLSKEDPAILGMYGIKEVGDGSFASNCLLARRMAERGVRMIQLYHRAWDHHGSIEAGMKDAALDVDQASAALIRDLKQRGMLEDTLVIWGGEFGRTPMGQGTGRDHHILGFSLALAGGGVRPGSYGNTDELGYRAVENMVHVHDLHATLLHLLGIDHLRMTVKHQGLDMRLTGVGGKVVKGILA